MARLIRTHDWAATPLGSVEGWPGSLRTAVDMVLAMPGPAGILWGPAHVQLYNDAYIAIAGDRHPALLGRPAAEGWPEVHAKVLAPMMEAAFAGRATRILDLSVALLGPDGQPEERVFDTTWSPIRDGSGAVAGALEILGEVDDRRKVQAALRESEERLTTLLELLPVGVGQFEVDGRLVVTNPALRRLMGETIPSREALPRWRGCDAAGREVPPDDFPGSRALRGESVPVGVDFFTDADGTPRWFQVGAVPLRADGAVTGGICVTVDVTERRRAEAALRESEERLRLALDAAEMGSFVWLPGADRVESDARTLAFFGMTHPGELTYRRVLELLHPEDREAHEASVAHAVDPAGDGALRSEVRIRLPDGTWRWLAMAGQTRFDVQGRVLGMNGATRDITAHKAAEAALHASEERHAFLLELADALRSMADPVEVQATATRLLGAHLRASRVYYYEFDEAAAIGCVHQGHAAGEGAILVGAHAAADWPTVHAAMRAGESLCLSDAASSPRLTDAERAGFGRLGFRALACVPLVKDGRLVAVLNVVRAEPGVWTGDEVWLIEAVAERTWAAIERARAGAALRTSEERFRAFAENSADTIWIADRSGTRLDYLSPAFERMFGADRAEVTSDLRRWAELLHPADREEAMRAMPRTLAGEMVVVHYRVIRPLDGRLVHLRDTGFPVRDEAGAIVRVAGIVQDVSDVEAARAALEAEKERFRTLAEGIPQLVWRACDEGRWTWASPQWRDYTGQSNEESRGLGWLDAVHPEDRARTMAAWHEARPHGELDTEYRVRRASDGAWRWHGTRSVPLRAGPTAEQPEGRIVEWLGTATDIEDLKRYQAEQAVLVAELQHRTRNLLAVVRNVARRSIPPQPGRDEYDARLAALGRVQGFLARTGRYTVTLRALVEAELQAAGDGVSERVTVEGPPVELPGEGAQPVALALHELATNAVKYGAIAQPMGRLSIAWRVEEGEHGARLLITWRESGVPMPDGPPARRGYGSELITRALPYQMQAETALEFTPDGVWCSIALPTGAFRTTEVVGS